MKVTFKFKDPGTGAETNLSNAYVYLRDAAALPPMEKFYSKADYILGPSGNDGIVSKTVPEGTYHIRITKRIRTYPPEGGIFGPPEEGDYTWMPQLPITITAGATLDLGTLYAYSFLPGGATITGTVKNSAGVPLPGRYVRAQRSPCYYYSGGDCGPNLYPALKPTDASGAYTVRLREPGSYYIYVGSDWSRYAYAYYPSYMESPRTVTVNRGETINADVIAY
ncbi:MAG: carboxypeptidase regulatory-like domain-containing protein [Deltaproteobacteria bacterium]|nr:carboxypeptidase regulatory-like domain-containing protein [Deltaproteobacteria bacterium]